MKKIKLLKTFGIIMGSFLSFGSQAQTISSNLDGKIDVVENVSTAFEVTTTTGIMFGSTVKYFITLSDTNLSSAIHVEFFNPLSSTYDPINFVSGIAQFGPLTGFPFFAGSTDFRVTFDSATTYDYTLEIQDSTSAVIASSSESVTVNGFVSASVFSTLNGKSDLLQGIESDFTIYTMGGNDTSKNIWLNLKLNDSSLANSIHLSYFDGIAYQPLFFKMNGTTQFGNLTGINLLEYDSLLMKVTFDSATTYDYALELQNVQNSEILASANESVTIGSYYVSTISSTLNGRVGISTSNQDTFSVKVISGSLLGELVTLKSQLLDSLLSNKIHLEYFDGTTFQPLSFNSDGSLFFGPSLGFPLADATTEFRVTFDSATTYDYSFEIVSILDSSILAISNESVTIDEYLDPTIYSTLNGKNNLMVGSQDTFSLTTSFGSENNRMVLVSFQLDEATLYNTINMEYFDGITYQPLTFSAGGTLIFGATGGFLLADETSMFRVSFDSATTYNYTLSILDASTSEVLATTNENITINSIPVPATISTTLNGRSDLKTNATVNFITKLVANSDVNKTVQLKITLLDAGLSNFIDLKYFDGSSFQSLAFDNNGVAIYQSAGFALIDQSLTFSIEFDTATIVNYNFELIEMANNEVIAISTESVVVEKAPTSGIVFNDNINFAMMPNPANSYVTIDYDKSASVNIYDITGKLIKSTNISSNHSLEIADLKNGTYYVQLIDGANFLTKKLVVIH